MFTIANSRAKTGMPTSNAPTSIKLTCCRRRRHGTIGARSRTWMARGLLDSTLVVAMGEFGRTPRINGRWRP